MKRTNGASPDSVIPRTRAALDLLVRQRKVCYRGASSTAAWKFARALYDHPTDIDVMRACQTVAARLRVQPAQVALAWLLAKPAVTAPIIGATKIAHLETALAALDLPLSDGDIQELEACYQPHAVRGFD